jgi:hypothetical protein
MNHSVAMAVALRCVVCCARAERGARATSNHGLEAALCCHYSRFTPRPHSDRAWRSLAPAVTHEETARVGITSLTAAGCWSAEFARPFIA